METESYRYHLFIIYIYTLYKFLEYMYILFSDCGYIIVLELFSFNHDQLTMY